MRKYIIYIASFIDQLYCKQVVTMIREITIIMM